jgi:hypothetical protein
MYKLLNIDTTLKQIFSNLTYSEITYPIKYQQFTLWEKRIK